MRICIIGIGLIGGSLAIDLRKRDFASYIIGVDNNSKHVDLALKLGLVDEILSINEAIKRSDLIILAVPANHTINLLPIIMDQIKHQIICDVCSVKFEISKKIYSHTMRANYVSTHPMAGTEFSGPSSAISNLYDEKSVIFCDYKSSSDKALKLVKGMYSVLNMNILYMNSESHDMHAAYVSHISHISSFALALTVLDIEKNEHNILNLASGGFDSTVRLAKSSAKMWNPIFKQNSKNVLNVIENYINILNQFKVAIKSDNDEMLIEMINKANTIKLFLK